MIRRFNEQDKQELIEFSEKSELEQFKELLMSCKEPWASQEYCETVLNLGVTRNLCQIDGTLIDH